MVTLELSLVNAGDEVASLSPRHHIGLRQVSEAMQGECGGVVSASSWRPPMLGAWRRKVDDSILRKDSAESDVGIVGENRPFHKLHRNGTPDPVTCALRMFLGAPFDSSVS